jgi:hypothetical protein
MAHPLKHAQNSARKFGGKPEDYLPIHNVEGGREIRLAVSTGQS